ncbi:MAG TPA: carbonic anhydrase [Candidatus Nanoarchaeia archaeon]|nr:carbonic anhydrase [Candidatus Nanoarchaeia archaeon]
MPHVAHGKFGTVINCMDGRTQKVVADFLQSRYGLDWVDTITEPGPNKILADGLDINIIENIRQRLEISINKHGSNLIAVVGHEECAGNPVDKEEHIKHLRLAQKRVEQFGFMTEIILLWVPAGWDKVEVVE